MQVAFIGAGFYNTLVACRKSGALFCAGENVNKQCGEQGGKKNLDKMQMVDEVAKQHVLLARGGYCHTLVLAKGGKVFSLGCGDDGQRGDGRVPEDPEREVVSEVLLPPGAGEAVDICAGANHSLVLDSRGRVYGFGSNEHGQLGVAADVPAVNENGDDDDDDDDLSDLMLAPTLLPLPPGTGKISSISAGYAHTVLTSENGKALVFGQNSNGQLGVDPDELESSSSVVELRVG